MTKKELPTPSTSKTLCHARISIQSTQKAQRSLQDFKTPAIKEKLGSRKRMGMIFKENKYKKLRLHPQGSLTICHQPQKMTSNNLTNDKPRDNTQNQLTDRTPLIRRNTVVEDKTQQEEEQSNENKYQNLLMPSKQDFQSSFQNAFDRKNKLRNRYRENQTKKEINDEENRKQRKVLANISFKVKEIVLQFGKLTYKEVSDKVLKTSVEDLQELPNGVREKQINNIRRRVYDALNVLVSVRILKKQKKNVMLTKYTGLPGKKLSREWDKVTFQQQYLSKLKKSCADKQINLSMLLRKYQNVQALRTRNETIQKKISSQINNKAHHELRINFPFLILVPSNDVDEKYMVQIREEETNQEVKIQGSNIKILSDVDASGYIRFNCLAKIEEIIAEGRKNKEIAKKEELQSFN